MGKEDLRGAVGVLLVLARGGEVVVEVQHGEHGAATRLLALASETGKDLLTLSSRFIQSARLNFYSFYPPLYVNTWRSFMAFINRMSSWVGSVGVLKLKSFFLTVFSTDISNLNNRWAMIFAEIIRQSHRLCIFLLIIHG